MTKWVNAGYYHLVEKFWGNRCAYCLKKIGAHNITRDHFIPRSKKGQNHKFNLVPACDRCNTAKCNNHPNKWCSDAQRAQVGTYFNALLAYDVETYKISSMPIDILEKAYDQYINIRKRFKSSARTLKKPLFNLPLHKKPEGKKKSKHRTVDEIIAAWRSGNVTRDTVHRTEQVRPELHQEILASGTVQDDGRYVWRACNGLYLLH